MILIRAISSQAAAENQYQRKSLPSRNSEYWGCHYERQRRRAIATRLIRKEFRMDTSEPRGVIVSKQALKTKEEWIKGLIRKQEMKLSWNCVIKVKDENRNFLSLNWIIEACIQLFFIFFILFNESFHATPKLEVRYLFTIKHRNA